MPGTIGKTVIGSGGASLFRNESLRLAGRQYTAVAGDAVTAVSAYLATGSPPANCEIGVYLFSGGVPTSLVNKTTVTVSSGSFAWVGATGLNWALTAGNVYVVAVGPGSGSGHQYHTSSVASGQSNDTSTGLPASWTENAQDNAEGSYFATVSTVSGSVSDGDQVTSIFLMEGF